MNKLKLISKIENDNYTEYVCQKYDIQFNEEHITEIPMLNIDELNTFNWNIGIICGNSGSGKTHLSKKIAELVFGDEKYLNRFDMSEYSDKTSVNKLIGTGAGYIGYENGGLLTEAITFPIVKVLPVPV